MNNKPIREARLYKKLPEKKVRCDTCERRCLIPPKAKGFCGTKQNLKGRLFTIAYGDISAVESRPIEIKPFFHFHPGSTALTFSTWGCNFRCPWCQNWHLSREKANPEKPNYISPEKMVEMAIKGGDKGLCVSFQEPTLLFEYSLDAFKFARKKGLYNCYVSNGYMTKKALRMLKESGMDAINIDIKGDEETYQKYCGGVDVEVVWRNIHEAKKLGLHIEVINLVVTGVNDSKDCIDGIIKRHLKEAGPQTPLHFTRYRPAHKFTEPSTKIKTLEGAYSAAKKAGTLYPYIGNVFGHRYENTYCPRCKELLIERLGFKLTKYRVVGNLCPKCGEEIPITI